MCRKKLLILGATTNEIDIVNAAHDLGLYTIVTDNHLDWSLAPAKSVADEAWNISWSDTETLAAYCRRSGINGCFAGFSERRIIEAQKLCTLLGLPFYADGARLNAICDKVEFKKACIECGIKVPLSYHYGDTINYPVIIKPADNGGSRGVTICRLPKEFDDAYTKALDASTSKEVLIEEYIVADEIMVYFTVHDDEIEVSAMCDRYMHHFCSQITQLPIGYFYPSKHLDTFLRWNKDKFFNLIHSLNIHNGLIAFQAFVIGRDIIPFDPTFRLDGTMSYHIVETINGSNVLKMMIHHSLTGSMGDKEIIAVSENPYFKRYAFQLPILLRKGVITNISGINSISSLPGVIHIQYNHSIGETMEKDADFSQIFCRIHIVEDSVEDIIKDIISIYSSLQVSDEKGEDMIICRMDTSNLLY